MTRSDGSTMADHDNPIYHIFHEKQEGSLCAQHCLNALLQNNLFTAVDLADIGRSLDEVERQQMAEAGTNSNEYMRFVQQPSSNYDDSGFFSIQVIQKAVSVWGLELVPFTSSAPEAVSARADPRTAVAYICNFREHWFTIRKLGHQWFNLNSLLTCPELVSDTYLALLLTQLQQEGYSILVVLGSLPDCEADQLLRVITAEQPVKPGLLTDKGRSPGVGGPGGTDEDPELAQALAESKRLAEEDDTSLRRALARSMEGLPADYGFPPTHSLPSVPESGPSRLVDEPPTETPAPTAAELRDKRLAFYSRDGATSTAATAAASEPSSHVNDATPSGESLPGDTAGRQTPDNISEISEEKMLEMALKMSMQADT